MALSYLEMRPVQVSDGKRRGRVDWILIGRDWVGLGKLEVWNCSAVDPGKKCGESRWNCSAVVPSRALTKEQFGLRSGGCLGMEKATGLAKLMVFIIVIA